MAIAEVCRNLVCSGAEPLAITDCLNFGNPERPEIMEQLSRCHRRARRRGATALGVPIVSGNVSLYNETDGTGDLADADRRRGRAAFARRRTSSRSGSSNRATSSCSSAPHGRLRGARARGERVRRAQAGAKPSEARRGSISIAEVKLAEAGAWSSRAHTCFKARTMCRTVASPSRSPNVA